MRFQDVARRLTGLSCPIFGVNWQPAEPEINAARRVIRFLEDRRVLYVPRDAELSDYCVKSVLEIRAFLTQELGGLDDRSPLAPQLQAMRAACRKFLQVLEGADEEILGPRGWPRHDTEATFYRALGELRGVFGVHVAQIAAAHGLDVEPELASILPGEEDPGDEPDLPPHAYRRLRP